MVDETIAKEVVAKLNHLLTEYDIFIYPRFSIYCNLTTLQYLAYGAMGHIVLTKLEQPYYMGHRIKIDDTMEDTKFRFVLYEE